MKRIQPIENLKGLGKVMDGVTEIAKVHYNLNVQQEIDVVETAGGKKEIPGHFNITGSISVTESKRIIQAGEQLTLYMQDGRKDGRNRLNFIVSSLNLNYPNNCKVVGNDYFY